MLDTIRRLHQSWGATRTQRMLRNEADLRGDDTPYRKSYGQPRDPLHQAKAWRDNIKR